ncbi:hypothetical protein ETH_00038960, partial [Eimeria tenella]
MNSSSSSSSGCSCNSIHGSSKTDGGGNRKAMRAPPRCCKARTGRTRCGQPQQQQLQQQQQQQQQQTHCIVRIH